MTEKLYCYKKIYTHLDCYKMSFKLLKSTTIFHILDFDYLSRIN